MACPVHGSGWCASCFDGSGRAACPHGEYDRPPADVLAEIDTVLDEVLAERLSGVLHAAADRITFDTHLAPLIAAGLLTDSTTAPADDAAEAGPNYFARGNSS